MIRLANVSKRFKKLLAVDDLTLHVPAGEIYGILGHNGAGKSTVIGMVLGQVWPSDGTVRVCGHDVGARRRTALEKVGAIFESPAFYDYLSGWRNLEIISSYTSRTPPQRIREVVEWVGLTGREHSKVRTYSHGMRARLALAQALLPSPQLLILDEPSDGLDPEGIHEMRHTILRLHRELGLTIFLSSHLLNEVEQLCTRISVLNRGRKVFEGTLKETKDLGKWLRLEVHGFAGVCEKLHNAGFISDHRQPNLVLLRDASEPAQIVKFLVEHDVAVHEICRYEETLEDFYLGLMKVQPRPGQSAHDPVPQN